MKKYRRTKGIKMVLAVLAIGAILTTAVMLLWNALIPGIFGLAAINFWQALGLFVLARILFSGLGGRRRMMHGGMHHKNHLHEKWMNMSPEERKVFIKERREQMKHHPFGRHECFDEHFGSEPEAETKKDIE